ncbi:RtcB family protein [Candidatus Woesearchaeota archaeon]|nr:RtcB family protein [Candidatus Woesearchaeota archaeon]
MSEVPKDIKKINEVTWEIPTSYKQGMNVPARIIATESLLKAMDPGVFNQVTNVATLPGIVKYSICHADGHWGYGFPIGGVAAFDIEEGVISPGGIGFDINCVSPKTKILMDYGYYRKIKDLREDLSKEKISFISLKNRKKESSPAVLLLKKKADNNILKIKTKYGEEITVSEDHPLLTNNGFEEAGNLRKKNGIITHPFVGVEYKKPTKKVILDSKDIITLIGNRKKLIKELKQKRLLPLKFNSEKLPILAKLVGFLTGDGWIGTYYSKKRKSDIWSMRVIGKLQDLGEVRNDIAKLGYIANHITTKEYTSKLKEINGDERKIYGTSNQLYLNSQSLAVLLHALGVPKGNKSKIIVNVPIWIKKAPLWIKRLYLAGLFGAELNRPCQRKGEPCTFTEPSFSQNKIDSLERENLNFMLEITNLLLEFGVNINKVYKQKVVVNVDSAQTHKLALRISAKPENLINLWSKVGYEYCKDRKESSMLALAYLKYKQKTLKRKTIASGKSISIKENNGEIMLITQISEDSFPTFAEFSEKSRIKDSEFISDEVEEIVKLDYRGDVYDLTMDDKNHNFIANCIVSHNCGMRSIVTNLTQKEVQPKIKELTDTLFKLVPAGVGCKGFVKLTRSEFNEVMCSGSKWCVERGYGWEEDLEGTEDYGTLKGANPEKVSERAISRGISQLGTLGSGNHYLEIQIARAENIYDEKTAKKFGIIDKDQVIITTHCGSRGFGHQNATDYLKVFERIMKEHNIKVSDRELSCAPFQTKEAQDYYSAMKCSGNMAYANRQVIMHRIREAFKQVFKKDPEKLGMHLIYDCTHNLAREHKIKLEGKMKKVLVHLKGATTSVGPGYERLTSKYEETGSPIIIGGSMETGSYLMMGTRKAEEETFGTTIHGAGRTMSRTKAKSAIRGEKLQKDMEKKGIYVRGVSMSGLAEEAGFAYKDLTAVGDSVEKAGISKRIVLLKPIGNVKG